MKFLVLIFSILFSSYIFAAPVSYQFTATYNIETRGDPSINTFFPVTDPTQLLYSAGTTITGSFVYDSSSTVTNLDSVTGFSESGTAFTATLDGQIATDNNLATIILNNTNLGSDDFIGLYIDPPVGSTLPNELSGFNRTTTSSGENFALYNFRFLWLQDGGNDFVSGFENPSSLPPLGHNGATRLAIDFLLLNSDGSLNNNVQQIVFFENVQITSTSPVPVPPAFMLLISSLSCVFFKRRKIFK